MEILYIAVRLKLKGVTLPLNLAGAPLWSVARCVAVSRHVTIALGSPCLLPAQWRSPTVSKWIRRHFYTPAAFTIILQLIFDVTTSNVSFLRGSNTQERDVTAGPLPDVTSLQSTSDPTPEPHGRTSSRGPSHSFWVPIHNPLHDGRPSYRALTHECFISFSCIKPTHN